MPNKTLNFIFSILLGLLNFSAIGVIVWASYRGLELSDESFYYLGYRYNDNVPNLTPSSFHLIYNRFFSFLDLGLTGVRLLRLFLTMLASLVLYFSIARLKASTSLSEKLVLFNVIVSGMLLSYTWAPMALSYNSMSSLVIAFVIGVWLLSLRSKARVKTSCWAILGGLLVLLFFIKATNLVLFPLILLADLYWYYTPRLSKKTILIPHIANILAFILGVFLMLIFVSEGIGSIIETVNNHLQQLFGMANADTTHSFSYLWDKYYKNAEMVVQKLKYPILGLLVLYVFTILFLKIKTIKNTTWPTLFFKITGILVFLGFLIQNEYWKGGTQFKYKILIPYIFGVTFSLLNQSVEAKKINLPFLLALLSIPIFGAVGTNNGLSAQVLFYGVFIFLVLYYALNASINIWFKQIMLGILLLLTTLQVISGTVLRPYRLSPLTKNTISLDETTALSSLKVDRSVFELSENLKSLKTLEAEYIFAYSGMLGVNLLTDKKPYSLEWFNEGDDEKICAIIKKSQIAPRNILFLIPEKIPLTKKIISCLAEKGVHLKADYSKIKSFEFFYPRSNKNITLNVYQYTPK